MIFYGTPADPHLWPAITAASLLAGLAVTADADDKAAMTRALEGCGVSDCGQIRCDRCNERITCTGPEPRACGVTCVDCPCDCTTCLQVREELRAELAATVAGAVDDDPTAYDLPMTGATYLRPGERRDLA